MGAQGIEARRMETDGSTTTRWGNMEMNINYSSDHIAKVTSDGTNSQDTTFGSAIEIYLDTSTNVLASDQSVYTIYAEVAGSFWMVGLQTLTKLNHSTNTGGHTATGRSTVTGGPVG
jgi:hypothetical protein